MAEGASPTTSVPLGKWQKGNEAKVDSFLDRARHGIHCSLFCGGVKCKHEDWTLYTDRKNVHPAIEGLNSNWVGDNVIASQRPSTSLFLKYLLIQQFKHKSITGVFNLQEKGEHASCGPDGIYESSGYSYNGEEDLMRHGVHYYEFPWPDMTAPNTDVVLRSVQVMDMHVRSSGRVLVHCHAGLGRTGLLIACYMIYAGKMSSDNAIKMVRMCRPGSVQTSSQEGFVRGFERHLWDLQVAFRIELSDPRVELELFMKRQRQYLHGDEGDTYRVIPKPLHYLLCRAISLAQEDTAVAKAALEALAPTAGPEKLQMNDVCRRINRGELNIMSVSDARLLTFLSIDWFRSMSSPVLPESSVKDVVDFMKTAAKDRPTLTSFICNAFNRVVRHTVGLLASAVFILARTGEASDQLVRYAFKCVAEALTHTHTPTKSFLSKFEMELLADFFFDWGYSVEALYFDDTTVPAENKTIGKIASASHVTLDRTSGANILSQVRAASVEADDLSVAPV